ncbi:phosphomannomutase CpsG [Grimontia sp. NTOU-MAR1]|uniref:phosphomannomutase CpsG n=1 Tax=Grimontia sp. NTOU-MAR1 TaxID=3111011 RepID=UPI002DB73707|nr:phosphomannomutase CpsG [Grimontia sp. NTOU-MAR1]WRV97531.1 phosphomannomutase CpsG [Grimontia sp. NTOU-MAR1]
MAKMNCFTAYDVRGKLGEELNQDVAYRIGRAYGEHFKPKQVVVGGDVRLTSEELKQALAEGLMDAGADVIDLGMTGTEEIYFATTYLGVDGGVEVTASHNPINYNGMKFVKENSKPISKDSGLSEIKSLAEENSFPDVSQRGTLTKRSLLTEYVDHLLTYIDCTLLKPMRLVVNAGNGAAGHVIDELEARFKALDVPIEFIKVNHEPDGSFPNGIPNPLLPDCRADTRDAVIESGADLGIAWDGDFDRCFFFDENGEFIEGYYIVGLLAEAFLKKHPSETIIYDPRLYWNTIDIVEQAGGKPVMSKTGHAFIKEKMREQDAVYGGEMSAHHYFRDFCYCDSGMIPWILVIELLSRKRARLSEVVSARMSKYVSSGEINCKVKDADLVIGNVLSVYGDQALSIDYTDGIGLDMGAWRFNLRKSNTEPLLRLNIETRNDSVLKDEKLEELLRFVGSD